MCYYMTGSDKLFSAAIKKEVQHLLRSADGAAADLRAAFEGIAAPDAVERATKMVAFGGVIPARLADAIITDGGQE
jgi:hypothetical protein